MENVDKLAHTGRFRFSPPENVGRDVDDLLDKVISVISTVDIWRLESLDDIIKRITGIKQRETRPDGRSSGPRGPDRARRHGARGAAQTDGARATAPPGRRSTRQSISALAMSLRCESWHCCGWRTALTRSCTVPASGMESRGWETKGRVLVALTGAPRWRRPDTSCGRVARRNSARRARPCSGVWVTAWQGRRTSGWTEHRELLEEVRSRYVEAERRGENEGARASGTASRTRRSLPRAQAVEVGGQSSVRGSIVDTVIHLRAARSMLAWSRTSGLRGGGVPLPHSAQAASRAAVRAARRGAAHN